MTYRAPLDDILLALNHGAAAAAAGRPSRDKTEIAAAVLEEAGKFAGDVLAPLNRVGDQNGIKLSDGKVTTAPGWPDAYQRWTAAGWNAVAGREEFGGQGLPGAINAACTEIWSAANIAFELCPLLTAGAIEALDAHGSDELKPSTRQADFGRMARHLQSPSRTRAPTSAAACAPNAPRRHPTISGTMFFITYGATTTC